MIGKIVWQVTYEYQSCIEIFAVFLDVFRIVLGRLPLVYRVKVDAGIICFDGLEESSEGILKAAFCQWAEAQARI